MKSLNKLFTLFAGIATCFACQSSLALEGSASVDLASAYVFRGAELHDELSLQPSFELGLPLGEGLGNLTLGTWMEAPLGDVEGYNEILDEDGGTIDDGVIAEVDVYLGYGITLGDYDVGLTYTEYMFPVAGGSPDRELSLSTSTKVGGVDLGLMAAFGIDGVFDEGLYLEATTGYALPVGQDMDLDLGLTLGAELGDNFEENGLSHLTISTGTDLGPFALGLNYVVETDDDVQEIGTDFYGTLGYSF